ncbi:MAG: c-type cytochrome [Halieaceae bacterium]
MKVISITAGLALALIAGPGMASEQRMADGKAVYETTCKICHESGIAGAPQTRNAADWEGRSSLWESVLFEHANKGYLAMPPKGGAEDASDYDVEAAAEYMLTITHPELQAD